MNKFLVLVCCLASLASVRSDVSLGYKYNPNYNSGADLLAAPFTSSSYSPAASGVDGAASGSVNFLAPEFNVAGSSSSSSSSYSGGSAGLSVGASDGFSGSLGNSGGAGFIGTSGLSNGYTSGGYGSVGYGGGYNGGASSIGLGSLGITGGSGYNNVAVGSGLTGVYTGGINQAYNGGASSIGLGQQYAAAFQQQAPIITKNFYVHSAPEDHDEQQIVRYVTIGRPLKNYRVVFINAPSSTSTRAKIIANVAPVEDRTAIYVLSKKSNDLDISADVVTPAPTAPNKPDVFFIKYKTPQEAIHAQHVIQAQYDQLGGQSSYSNEGFAPVQSVIGHLDAQGHVIANPNANSQGSTQIITQGGSLGGNSGGSLVGFGGSSGLSSGSLISGNSGGSLVGFGGNSGSSFGGGSGTLTGFQRTSGSDFVSGGLLPDQSQIDQVTGGRIQPQPNYLPPNKYKKY